MSGSTLHERAARSALLRWMSDTVIVPPRRIPLEIGPTRASVMLLHIRSELGVARWPYRHDQIRVFLNMEHVLPECVWYRDVKKLGCSCHTKGLPGIEESA